MTDRRLLTFEEHGEVLAFWSGEHVQGANLVFFDQHLDLKRIGQDQLARIRAAAISPRSLRALCKTFALQESDRFAYGSDDFLYAAAELGMFQTVVWVHPEPTALKGIDLGSILWQELSLVPGAGHEVIRSFSTGPHSASARIRGMTIIVTTLKTLRASLPDGDLRFDIDLDFFFNATLGRLVHDIDDVARVVEQVGLADHPLTLSYSIGSGHLPARYRSLGAELSTRLGRKLRAASDTLVRSGPDAAWILRQSDPELDGVRHSVQAQVSLSNEDLPIAASEYWAAIEAGDRATATAYKIGLHYLGRSDYKHALAWFERMTLPLTDSIQANALCLSALCAYRLGEYARSLDLARRSVDELPMRDEGYLIAALAEQQLRRGEAPRPPVRLALDLPRSRALQG